MGYGRGPSRVVCIDLCVLRCVRFSEVETAYLYPLRRPSRRIYISGAVFIFIAAAAPNKASLGATNGLAQLSVSAMRAVGPAFVSSVYSLTIDEKHHYMNGGLVYYVTASLGVCGILVGSLLPKHPFKRMK